MTVAGSGTGVNWFTS